MRLLPVIKDNLALRIFITPKAVEFIAALTADLSPRTVDTLVANRIPLWDIIPEDFRDEMLDQLRSYRAYVSHISDETVKAWVTAARPDLKQVLSRNGGVEWFSDFLQEVRDGAG